MYEIKRNGAQQYRAVKEVKVNRWGGIHMEKLEVVDTIKEKLAFIVESDEDIDENIDLFKVGLDSIKTIRLVVELETIFDITIEDDDLVIENFSTLSKIVEMVNSKIN